MIYLIWGNDFKRARGMFNKYLAVFRAKQPAADVFHFEPDSFDPGRFKEVATGETLFLNKHIVLGWRLSENETARTLVSDLVADLAARPSIFLLYETGSDKELIALLSKYAREEKSYFQIENQDPAFNLFTLADMLGRRRRQELWVLYQQALRQGIKPADVFWKFVWQVKNMLLVVSVPDIQTTGLKPFVANKALQASRRYSSSELRAMFNRLVNLLDQTYPESEEFNFRLEHFILTI